MMTRPIIMMMGASHGRLSSIGVTDVVELEKNEETWRNKNQWK